MNLMVTRERVRERKRNSLNKGAKNNKRNNNIIIINNNNNHNNENDNDNKDDNKMTHGSLCGRHTAATDLDNDALMPSMGTRV